MNKPLTQTDKLGNVISWAYDSKGNVISILFQAALMSHFLIIIKSNCGANRLAPRSHYIYI